MTYWNELFNYDPNTGVLSWKKWRRGAKRSLVAGTKERDGYVRVKHKNKHIPVHRIIWDMCHPNDVLTPGFEIDHINHIRDGNRILNLRKVVKIDNNRNTTRNKANTSGVVGVHFNRSRGKWVAVIYDNRKLVFLGHFSDFKDAVAVRKAAEIKYNYHENHGSEKP